MFDTGNGYLLDFELISNKATISEINEYYIIYNLIREWPWLMSLISAIKNKNDYLFRHSIKVAYLAYKIADKLNMNNQKRKSIIYDRYYMILVK